MSSSLVFETEDGGTEALSFATKVRLSPKFFDHDGSLGGPGDVFTASHIPAIEAIAASSPHPDFAKDIEKLKREIETRGGVALWFEV